MTFLSQLRDVPARLRNESRQVPTRDVDEAEVEVESTAHAAAGVTAVAVAMRRAVGQMGVRRAASTLTRLNQVDGFDCQGCAWPDPAPGHRHAAEFCENGAKAVAEEATRQLLDREFFATHSVADLAGRTEFWLGKQGRITEPMVLRPGATHYTPISWDDAFATMADHLRRLDHPDQATFYTSGKTSNEAAFVYQLFVRAFGTNNLPDCSNMCHESCGSALGQTIGIGKGSVSLEDIHQAKLILVVGQNPGTNHPRMLSALEEAKAQRGAHHLRSTRSRRRAWSGSRTPSTPRASTVRDRAGRPAPADPPQRRPRALPGDRRAADRVGRGRPRLPRGVHHRLHRVRRARAPTSTGTRSRRPPGSRASRSPRRPG